MNVPLLLSAPLAPVSVPEPLANVPKLFSVPLIVPPLRKTLDVPSIEPAPLVLNVPVALTESVELVMTPPVKE